MHDHNEEGRGDKIEAKAHDKDLFLHHAPNCIAAISYCDQGRAVGLNEEQIAAILSGKVVAKVMGSRTTGEVLVLFRTTGGAGRPSRAMDTESDS